MQTDPQLTDASEPSTLPPRRARETRARGRGAADRQPIRQTDVGLVELYLAQLRQRAGWSAGSRRNTKRA